MSAPVVRFESPSCVVGERLLSRFRESKRRDHGNYFVAVLGRGELPRQAGGQKRTRWNVRRTVCVEGGVYLPFATQHPPNVVPQIQRRHHRLWPICRPSWARCWRRIASRPFYCKKVITGPTNSRPTVHPQEIRARVGLRKNSMQVDGAPGPSVKATAFLVGPALDDAEAAGEELDIFWPFDDTQITQWAQAEAIW